MAVFSPGQLLQDRYALVGPVGSGGMSEVWRAEDGLLGRPVAVKVLATPLLGEPALRAAIWREARALARLSHPHLTQVHDYGEVELPGAGVTGYLVMELVHGRTLAGRLADGQIPWPTAVRVVRQVAAALAAAHRAGVVHRDVKPGNVMLTDTGVKVLDFGIAAAAGGPDTDPGRRAGTPTYLAPERLEAAPATPASDVYSLGVLMYEVLTGNPPVVLPDWHAALAAHRAGRTAPEPVVGGLPATVAELCRSCLSPDPAHRPAAGDVVAALAGYTEDVDPVGHDATGTAAATDGTGPAGTDAAGAPATAPGGAATVPAARSAATVPAYRVGTAAPVDYGRPAAGAGAGGTVVDDRGPVDGSSPAATGPSGPARRAGWWLPVGVAAVAVLALVVTLALLRGPERTGTKQAGPGGSAPSDAVGPGTAAGPAPPSSPTVAGPDDPVAALELAVTGAFAAGELSRDARDDLRDELDDLREALTEPAPDERAEEARDVVAGLREEIRELRAEGELTRAAADRLGALLERVPVDHRAEAG